MTKRSASPASADAPQTARAQFAAPVPARQVVAVPGETDAPQSPDCAQSGDVEIDGFYVREFVFYPPAGAPAAAGSPNQPGSPNRPSHNVIRLVIRRATNALNLRVEQTASRLLAHMEKVGRDAKLPALRRYVTNFAACLAQTLVVEGMPDLDWWPTNRLGMGDERLLETFDRWMAYDGGLTNLWIGAIVEADAVRWADQPPLSRPSAPG